MKRLICFILSIVMILGCIILPVSATEYNYQDLDTLIELIEEQENRMIDAHEMAEAARRLGYAEDHSVIVLAQQEWWAAYYKKAEYQTEYDTIVANWEQKEKEYPTATYVWKYLKNQGYNDYVCAGIIGNMMTEVGGNTLNLQYNAYGSAYYGLCQWSKGYSAVWGTSLEYQCQFLYNTIAYEFNTYGNKYQKGFNYQSFLNLTDERAAALAFAKCYERCGSSGYKKRQNNAETAYNYFTS